MNQTNENLKLLKKFTLYVIQKLSIKSNANIIFLIGDDSMKNYPSAGGYLPGQGKIIVAVKNRALADIMRTLAHELTHHRQYELNMIGPNDIDNQKLEDEANICSGKLVRWFGRKCPEIYNDIK